MADDADYASDLIDQNMEQALARRAAMPTKTTKPVGYCLNPLCGDEFPDGDRRLFCGRKCADEAAKYG